MQASCTPYRLIASNATTGCHHPLGWCLLARSPRIVGRQHDSKESWHPCDRLECKSGLICRIFRLLRVPRSFLPTWPAPAGQAGMTVLIVTGLIASAGEHGHTCPFGKWPCLPLWGAPIVSVQSWASAKGTRYRIELSVRSLLRRQEFFRRRTVCAQYRHQLLVKVLILGLG